MKSILDPTFQYTPSHCTNIRKLFQRVREELRKQAERDATLPANVKPLQSIIIRKKA